MKRGILFFGLVLSLYVMVESHAAGQVKVSGVSGSDEVESFPKFAYSTSFGLSLSGPVYTSEFKLVDELGFEFDVMSLLKNDSIREEIGLTNEQLKRMQAIKDEVNKSLGDIVASISSEEERNNIKDRILGAEQILYNQLDPDQANRLEQLKNQLGIARYGIVPYLNRNSLLDEVGLSTSEKTQFQNQSKSLLNKFEKELEELNRRLNLQLIETLSDRAQKQLCELFSDDNYSAFLAHSLWASKPASLKKLRQSKMRIQDVIKSQRALTELGISDEQKAEIKNAFKRRQTAITSLHERLSSTDGPKKSAVEKSKALKAFEKQSDEVFAEKLHEILLERQKEQLVQIWIEMETRKMGTVGSLAVGEISSRIETRKSSVQALHEKGLELERIRDVEQSKMMKQFRDEVIKLYKPRHSNRIAELIGEPTQMKLR